MKNINAGDLRHRVTLQRLSTDPEYTPAGNPVEGWQDVGTYWALVEPLSGQELVNAAQTVANVSHRITMRVVGPITSRDQFLFKGRTLTIGSVIQPNEKADVYEVLCIEVKA